MACGWSTHTVNLRIRRYDLYDEPEIIRTTIEIDPNRNSEEIKTDLANVCGIDLKTHVLKIRNTDEILVPLEFLIEIQDSYYIVDVAYITYKNPNKKGPYINEYAEALNKRITRLTNRVINAEAQMPQLQCRQQVHTEKVVSSMLEKVSFMNRKFDEMCPEEIRKALAADICSITVSNANIPSVPKSTSNTSKPITGV